MNDEPSSSDVAPPVYHDDATRHAAPAAADIEERRRKNRRMFNRKRSELLDDLLKSLDILVYAELSCVYYMDTSFWRFFIRVMVQFIFLTPKPPMLPQAPPGNKPYIGAILGSNAICIILHAYQHAPSAGEATRGYMHGGLAMDFIGQKGPSSKIHLLLLDLFVVFLQLTQLSVLLTVHKLKESSSTSRASTTRPAATRQDLDSEERGVRRSIEQQDIEMQNLNSSGTTTTPPQETDHPTDPDLSGREALLATTTPGRRTDANIFDAFNSGQIVVADLDIPNTVREQFWLYRAESLADAGDARTMRANITGQLLRWRSGGLAGRNVQTV